MYAARLVSPPSVSCLDSGDYNRHCLSETSSHPMPDVPFSTPGPWPIPSRSVMNSAPPPLPPPPRLRDLENGYNAGWLHANPAGSRVSLAPINSNSSLLGSHRRPELAPQIDRMAIDELEGRQKGIPTSGSPEAHIKVEPPPRIDEGFPSSMSAPTSGPM